MQLTLGDLISEGLLFFSFVRFVFVLFCFCFFLFFFWGGGIIFDGKFEVSTNCKSVEIETKQSY